jgi:hypothetical protein
VKNCWRTRNRTLAVEGEHVASRSEMKSETWSRGDDLDLDDAGLRQRDDELVGRLAVRLDLLGARLEAGAPPVGLEPTTRCLEAIPADAPS